MLLESVILIICCLIPVPVERNIEIHLYLMIPHLVTIHLNRVRIVRSNLDNDTPVYYWYKLKASSLIYFSYVAFIEMLSLSKARHCIYMLL